MMPCCHITALMHASNRSGKKPAFEPLQLCPLGAFDSKSKAFDPLYLFLHIHDDSPEVAVLLCNFLFCWFSVSAPAVFSSTLLLLSSHSQQVTPNVRRQIDDAHTHTLQPSLAVRLHSVGKRNRMCVRAACVVSVSRVRVIVWVGKQTHTTATLLCALARGSISRRRRTATQQRNTDLLQRYVVRVGHAVALTGARAAKLLEGRGHT